MNRSIFPFKFSVSKFKIRLKLIIAFITFIDKIELTFHLYLSFIYKMNDTTE